MIDLFNLKGVSYSHYVECYNFSPLFFKSPRLMSSYHAYRVTSGFTGKHTHSQVHSQIHSTHTHTNIRPNDHLHHALRACSVHRQPLKFNDAQQQDRERMRGVTDDTNVRTHCQRIRDFQTKDIRESLSLSTSTFLTSYILKETHSQLLLL